MDEQSPSLRLVSALTNAWEAIGQHHPELPQAVVLPAPSQDRRMRVLGHFAPLRWKAAQNDERLHEVVVVAEHLQRDPHDVFEVLLHEAAHAVNFARGVKDCSRSQYHNRRFKQTGEELGLVVTQVAHYGFALTALSEESTRRYQAEIEQIGSVCIHRIAPGMRVPKGGGVEVGTNGPKTQPSRQRKAVCSCPFIIRLSRTTFASTRIRCESCGALFMLS